MAFDCELYLSVYRHSPVGLVIVDDRVNLVEVSRYMLGMFGLEGEPYQGERFGKVFNCASLQPGVICGETEACETCDLRAGVTAVLNQGASISDFTVNHGFRFGSAVELKWFKVSANAIDVSGRKHAVVSFVDITKEKQYEELLKNELSLDLATGTLNKHSLLNALKGLANTVSANKIFSVGIIDFDDFKDINDRFGHLAGDRVLGDFAHMARAAMRAGDIIGRYGGEEFMFVLPGADIDASAAILKRVVSDMNGKYAPEMRVTFSAGFVQLDIADLKRMSAEDIIGIVDGYLYEAKKAGKKRLAANGVMIALDG